ncbi:MAG: GGDEF domain-containing protein [Sulfurimonas sp.]
MKKKELVSLVDKMCKSLLVIIDEQDSEATLEQVAGYLRESANVIATLNKDKISNIAYTEALFHNAYEDLAKKSITSYKNTNENIKKLSKLHEKTLLECSQDQIDLKSITSKFNEIQIHMSNEVTKANEIITKLTSQVKNLEEKTNLDAMTKVFNRRALSSYLDNICSHKKLPFNLHLLILDIDDFKNVNDTYGHLAGDKVLIFIANTLKKTLRDGDKIFRYGGEEFIIILNRTDYTHCKNTTNRLIKLIRDNKLIYKGNDIQATISVGATKFREGDEPDSLIARADKALYKAKANGKNQLYTEILDGI